MIMDKFLKMLDEKGIKDKVLTAFKNDPDISIGDILEYEMMQDEELEDCFLQEAHETAMNTIIGAIIAEDLKDYFMNPEKLDEMKNAVREASQKLLEAFSSALNGLFEE